MAEKKNKWLVVLLSLLILFCLFLFLYYISAKSATVGGQVMSSLTNNVSDEVPDKVNIKADVSLEKNVVYVKQEIAFNKIQNSFLCYVPSTNYSKTIVKQISSDKGISEFNINGSNLYIKMSSPQNKVYIEYEITLEEGKDTSSYSEDKILLTNFLITAGVKNGNDYFRTYTSSIGDPFLYDMSNYDITVKAHSNYTAYGEGKTAESVNEGYKYARFIANNHRDFSLVIAKSASVITEKYKDINITYIDSYDSKAYVQNALAFAELEFCKYPYKDLVVASVDMKNSGMEFSGMVFINQSSFQNLSSHKALIYHEIFHQWFYGIIGTNQLEEPFLDEGLVTFFSAYLTNDLGKYGSCNKEFLHMKLSDYSDKTQYFNIAYANSAKYINELYNEFGENEFFVRMKKLFDEKSFQMVSYNQFTGYFK